MKIILQIVSVTCLIGMIFSSGVLLSPYLMKQKSSFIGVDFSDIVDSQNKAMKAQTLTLEQLEDIYDFVKWTKEYFDETITRRVAGLMIKKLQRNPEAIIGKIYKASIIVVYMEDQDGEFMKHGEIEFEEGTPSSLGMMWERIP